MICGEKIGETGRYTIYYVQQNLWMNFKQIVKRFPNDYSGNVHRCERIHTLSKKVWFTSFAFSQTTRIKIVKEVILDWWPVVWNLFIFESRSKDQNIQEQASPFDILRWNYICSKTLDSHQSIFWMWHLDGKLSEVEGFNNDVIIPF